MNYIRYAEYYSSQAQYDWIKRVLIYQKKKVEENMLKSKSSPFTSISIEYSLEDRYGLGRVFTPQRERFLGVVSQKKAQPKNFPPVEVYGLGRIRTGDLRRVRAMS